MSETNVVKTLINVNSLKCFTTEIILFIYVNDISHNPSKGCLFWDPSRSIRFEYSLIKNWDTIVFILKSGQNKIKYALNSYQQRGTVDLFRND